MKTIKTNELIESALDWAVCKAGGGANDLMQWWDGYAVYEMYHYSTDWAQSGPIIEREGITVSKTRHGFWEAHLRTYDAKEAYQTGPTSLIAAMRCYVASKLGDTINVPEELL